MLPKTILYATDFSPNTSLAQELAIDLARALSASLIVLHVLDPTLGYPPLEEGESPILKARQAAADKSLQALSQDCSHQGISAEAILRVGFPAFEIVRLAEERSVGLIIMGTHGWTGLKHLIVGSTAENVVRTAKCGVLTVRAREDAP